MSFDDTDEQFRREYGLKVGERLRSIRRQKRLSLQEVEASSGQEFKASVLGAYERGERAISVPRLQRLARYYHVPVDQLLPAGGEDEDDDESSGRRNDNEPAVKLDLTRLEAYGGPEAATLTRYVRMIQVQRQDFNGRVLTIRRDDMRAIAAILGVAEDQVDARMVDLGLKLGSPAHRDTPPEPAA